MKLAPSILYTTTLVASAISATATEKGGFRGGSEVEDGVVDRVLAYKKPRYEKYHEVEEKPYEPYHPYKPYHPYPKSSKGKGKGKGKGRGKGKSKGGGCEPVSRLTIDFIQGNTTFFDDAFALATPFLFDSPIFNEPTEEVIGAVTGVCHRLSVAPGIAACAFTYYDERMNSVTASGDIIDLDGGILAITGGTKEFQGAFGEVLLKPVDFELGAFGDDVLINADAYNGTLSIKLKKYCGYEYYEHEPYYKEGYHHV